MDIGTDAVPEKRPLPPAYVGDRPEPVQEPSYGLTPRQRVLKRIGRDHHAKLSPSKTTAGRRAAYIRQKAAKLGISVEECELITHRKPNKTRYGREQKARREAAARDA
jgi:hypothetical protein